RRHRSPARSDARGPRCRRQVHCCRRGGRPSERQVSPNHEDRPLSPAPPSDPGQGDMRLTLAEAAFRLKDEARGGWLLRGVRDPESVAAHSWGTALLCLLYADDAGVDRDRAMVMALVHDLAEARTGDVVARADAADREVSEAVKATLEAAAI